MTRRATLQTCAIATVMFLLSVPLFTATYRKSNSVLTTSPVMAEYWKPLQARRQTLAARLFNQ